MKKYQTVFVLGSNGIPSQQAIITGYRQYRDGQNRSKRGFIVEYRNGDLDFVVPEMILGRVPNPTDIPDRKSPIQLALKPVSLRVAREFVANHHRHHKPPQGGKFAISVVNEVEEILGVIIVGRPVARALDDGYTAEVTRLAVLDNVPNGCSMLYGAAWRAARGMGYTKMITYILASESGGSLRATGWVNEGCAGGGSWDRKSRARTDTHPVCAKERWSVGG